MYTTYTGALLMYLYTSSSLCLILHYIILLFKLNLLKVHVAFLLPTSHWYYEHHFITATIAHYKVMLTKITNTIENCVMCMAI